MAHPIIEDTIVGILGNIIELLCMAADSMAEMLGQPDFLDADTLRRRFRYEKPDAHTLQVLMCVRVASSLRAALILLEEAHTTEMAVLFRTIDDFLADIAFVDEVVEKGIENATTAQKEFLERYFIDDKRTTKELLERREKINYNAKRQKVQASEARTLGGDNPDRIKRMVSAIDDVFSGVVHGDYNSVMEMYGGDTLGTAKFQMRGIPTRFSEYRHHLGLQVHHALNMFFKVAYNLGHEELADSLRELRRKFENSPAYTTH